MNTNWWRRQDELDENQTKFILLPPNGKYQLIGPPGSGKTNLLLLRAQYIYGSVGKNILLLTFTKTLSAFIKGGNITEKIDPDQISTYHSWAFRHIKEQGGSLPIKMSDGFNDETREVILRELLKANEKIQSRRYYDAVFIDEAQDFSKEELQAVLCLTNNICICGDNNQGIHKRDGLSVSRLIGLEEHELTNHYRIGRQIAKVADKIWPPGDGRPSLEATTNYKVKQLGQSSANIHRMENRELQFEKMISLIRIELVAFGTDAIGVLCGKNETIEMLEEFFGKSDLSSVVCSHRIDRAASFAEPFRIHLLTIHGAKGIEFRAVHLFGAEDLLKWGLNHHQVSYTAVTRAKTALNVYVSPKTNQRLENAFHEPRPMELNELF